MGIPGSHILKLGKKILLRNIIFLLNKGLAFQRFRYYYYPVIEWA